MISGGQPQWHIPKHLSRLHCMFITSLLSHCHQFNDCTDQLLKLIKQLPNVCRVNLDIQEYLVRDNHKVRDTLSPDVHLLTVTLICGPAIGSSLPETHCESPCCYLSQSCLLILETSSTSASLSCKKSYHGAQMWNSSLWTRVSTSAAELPSHFWQN